MKKLMILSIPPVIMCLVMLFVFNSNTRAQARVAIYEKFEKTSSNSKFEHWFNSGQIDSISMRYLENACMMPDQSPTVQNRKSINEHFRRLYDSGIRFSVIKSVSKVITDSIAIDRGVWTVSLNAVPVASGTYLTQWHNLKGKWLIENEMSKSDKTTSPD